MAVHELESFAPVQPEPQQTVNYHTYHPVHLEPIPWGEGYVFPEAERIHRERSAYSEIHPSPVTLLFKALPPENYPSNTRVHHAMSDVLRTGIMDKDSREVLMMFIGQHDGNRMHREAQNEAVFHAMLLTQDGAILSHDQRLTLAGNYLCIPQEQRERIMASGTAFFDHIDAQEAATSSRLFRKGIHTTHKLIDAFCTELADLPRVSMQDLHEVRAESHEAADIIKEVSQWVPLSQLTSLTYCDFQTALSQEVRHRRTLFGRLVLATELYIDTIVMGALTLLLKTPGLAATAVSILGVIERKTYGLVNDAMKNTGGIKTIGQHMTYLEESAQEHALYESVPDDTRLVEHLDTLSNKDVFMQQYDELAQINIKEMASLLGLIYDQARKANMPEETVGRILLEKIANERKYGEWVVAAMFMADRARWYHRNDPGLVTLFQGCLRTWLDIPTQQKYDWESQQERIQTYLYRVGMKVQNQPSWIHLSPPEVL